MRKSANFKQKLADFLIISNLGLFQLCITPIAMTIFFIPNITNMAQIKRIDKKEKKDVLIFGTSSLP